MNAIFLGLFQAVNYALQAINIRACSYQRYVPAMLTDGLIAALNFMVIQHVASADNVVDQVGYTIGGMLGGAAGIYISKHWSESA